MGEESHHNSTHVEATIGPSDFVLLMLLKQAKNMVTADCQRERGYQREVG